MVVIIQPYNIDILQVIGKGRIGTNRISSLTLRLAVRIGMAEGESNDRVKIVKLN